MVKILVVFGTRPEAIKLATVIQELSRVFDVKVCVTAQHREMLDQILSVFNIKTDYDLNIMTPGQDLFDITGKIFNGIKSILIDESPNVVIVHGDTTTAMTAAIAASYMQIPVGHVEAGLRTYDIHSPFPEELNRQIISRIASFHFSPTNSARQNLLDEGIPGELIHVTGNTVVDALLSVLEIAREKDFPKEVLDKVPFLAKDCKGRKIILVTGHRRENFGKGFEEICHSLKAIANNNPGVGIIYPVHLNPNVQEPTARILSGVDNIYLIEPMEYLLFVKLMDLSYLILTDSGGIQEEAPSLGKPVLVMRNVTERQEALEYGTAKLVGTSGKRISTEVQHLLDDEKLYKQMSQADNPYGDGKASKAIRNILNEKKA